MAAARGEAEALFAQGNAHLEAGRQVEAAESFVACLRRAPLFAPGYINLADTLRRLGLYGQARPMAEQAAHLLPHSVEAATCLGSVLHDSTDYEAAAVHYRRALALAPDDAVALYNLGNTLHVLGEVDAALALLDRAVALRPEEPEFRFSRAATLLAAGDYCRGWEQYEWRWRRTCSEPQRSGAAWRGEDITGQTMLLHTEQGLGDTLQFVRYAPLVAARGARVVLEAPDCLLRLLRRVPGVAEVVARGSPLPRFERHCPLLSLPHAFATTLATVPAAIPYLHADPDAAAQWRARLPQAGLRVGLAWAGSPHRYDAGAHMIDRRRSLPAAELAALAAIPGVQFVSLQLQAPAAELPPVSGLFDAMAEVADFADTAAIAVNLDLVISVDTSVAHLAGGLGVPVWLLSRFDGCWRWLHGRDDSPWYPAMRLYRQDRPLDWSGVMRRVAHDLTQLAGSDRAPAR